MKQNAGGRREQVVVYGWYANKTDKAFSEPSHYGLATAGGRSSGDATPKYQAVSEDSQAP
jgi:hypothetical protein